MSKKVKIKELQKVKVSINNKGAEYFIITRVFNDEIFLDAVEIGSESEHEVYSINIFLKP